MSYCSIEKPSASTMYPGICQNRIRVRSRRRQMIAPLVFRVPGMSFYPGKMQLMGLCRRQKPLPEIDVFNRAGSALPVLFQPAVNPFFVKRIRHIFLIGNNFHPARLCQRFQTGDHRHQLHPVVGRADITRRKFPFMQIALAVHKLQNCAVAPRSVRVSSCRSVCKSVGKPQSDNGTARLCRYERQNTADNRRRRM